MGLLRGCWKILGVGVERLRILEELETTIPPKQCDEEKDDDTIIFFPVSCHDMLIRNTASQPLPPRVLTCDSDHISTLPSSATPRLSHRGYDPTRLFVSLVVLVPSFWFVKAVFTPVCGTVPQYATLYAGSPLKQVRELCDRR
jgi:hypothetical protein